MFDIFGILIGGISRIKSDDLPYTIFEEKKPTIKIINIIVKTQINVAVTEIVDVAPNITPSWAEHGTANAKSNVTIILSFLDGNILVVIVAIVSQPKPRIIGRIALPFNPITLNTLFTMIASLGRYPVSSSIPNIRKKKPTMALKRVGLYRSGQETRGHSNTLSIAVVMTIELKRKRMTGLIVQRICMVSTGNVCLLWIR